MKNRLDQLADKLEKRRKPDFDFEKERKKLEEAKKARIAASRKDPEMVKKAKEGKLQNRHL